jgi:hypothetical protein
MKKFLIVVLIFLIIALFVLVGIRGIVDDMEFLDELDSLGDQLNNFDSTEYGDDDYTDNTTGDGSGGTNTNNSSIDTSDPPPTGNGFTAKVNDGGGIGFYGREGTDHAGEDMSLFFDGLTHSLIKKTYAAKWKVDLDGLIIDTFTETFEGDNMYDIIPYLDRSLIIKEIGIGDNGVSYVIVEK